MKMNLLSILILNGFAPVVLSVQSVPATYYFVNQSMTWLNARSYCKVTYSDLAPVKTYSDLMKIELMAAAHNWSSPVWIGLYDDINNWRWSFHDLPLSAITLRKWNGGEPSNFKGNERCSSIKTFGAWNDLPCGTVRPFICYNAKYPGDGRFVGIAKPKLNWTDAQTYCRRFHTDLATALDEADNSALQQIAAAQGDSWFGLYRDGWIWTDQTKALNVHWASGQPDNNNTENCARFFGGLLDDASCTRQHTFICHYTPPIKRKMVKLQVKSDHNVFDAAVQSALLAKIAQKMEEHGMLKDITVTWRVQPDGNVFYKENNDL